MLAFYCKVAALKLEAASEEFKQRFTDSFTHFIEGKTFPRESHAAFNQIYTRLGVMAESLHNYTTAIKFFLTAQELSPEANVALIRCYLAQDKISEILDLLALQNDPTESLRPLLKEVSKVLFDKGLYKEVLALCKRFKTGQDRAYFLKMAIMVFQALNDHDGLLEYLSNKLSCDLEEGRVTGDVSKFDFLDVAFHPPLKALIDQWEDEFRHKDILELCMRINKNDKIAFFVQSAVDAYEATCKSPKDPYHGIFNSYIFSLDANDAELHPPFKQLIESWKKRDCLQEVLMLCCKVTPASDEDWQYFMQNASDAHCAIAASARSPAKMSDYLKIAILHLRHGINDSLLASLKKLAETWKGETGISQSLVTEIEEFTYWREVLDLCQRINSINVSEYFSKLEIEALYKLNEVVDVNAENLRPALKAVVADWQKAERHEDIIGLVKDVKMGSEHAYFIEAVIKCYEFLDDQRSLKAYLKSLDTKDKILHPIFKRLVESWKEALQHQQIIDFCQDVKEGELFTLCVDSALKAYYNLGQFTNLVGYIKQLDLRDDRLQPYLKTLTEKLKHDGHHQGLLELSSLIKSGMEVDYFLDSKIEACVALKEPDFYRDDVSLRPRLKELVAAWQKERRFVDILELCKNIKSGKDLFYFIQTSLDTYRLIPDFEGLAGYVQRLAVDDPTLQDILMDCVNKWSEEQRYADIRDLSSRITKGRNAVFFVKSMIGACLGLPDTDGLQKYLLKVDLNDQDLHPALRLLVEAWKDLQQYEELRNLCAQIKSEKERDFFLRSTIEASIALDDFDVYLENEEYRLHLKAIVAAWELEGRLHDLLKVCTRIKTGKEAAYFVVTAITTMRALEDCESELCNYLKELDPTEKTFQPILKKLIGNWIAEDKYEEVRDLASQITKGDERAFFVTSTIWAYGGLQDNKGLSLYLEKVDKNDEAFHSYFQEIVQYWLSNSQYQDVIDLCTRIDSGRNRFYFITQTIRAHLALNNLTKLADYLFEICKLTKPQHDNYKDAVLEVVKAWQDAKMHEEIVRLLLPVASQLSIPMLTILIETLLTLEDYREVDRLILELDCGQESLHPALSQIMDAWLKEGSHIKIVNLYAAMRPNNGSDKQFSAYISASIKLGALEFATGKSSILSRLDDYSKAIPYYENAWKSMSPEYLIDNTEWHWLQDLIMAYEQHNQNDAAAQLYRELKTKLQYLTFTINSKTEARVI